MTRAALLSLSLLATLGAATAPVRAADLVDPFAVDAAAVSARIDAATDQAVRDLAGAEAADHAEARAAYSPLRVACEPGRGGRARPALLRAAIELDALLPSIAVYRKWHAAAWLAGEQLRRMVDLDAPGAPIPPLGLGVDDAIADPLLATCAALGKRPSAKALRRAMAQFEAAVVRARILPAEMAAHYQALPTTEVCGTWLVPHPECTTYVIYPEGTTTPYGGPSDRL